jgi:hypothetical protein
MKLGRLMKIRLIIIPLVLFGCAGLNQTIDKSKDVVNNSCNRYGRRARHL